MGTASAAVCILWFFALKSCAPAGIHPDKLEVGWFAFVPEGGRHDMLRNARLAMSLRNVRLDMQSPEAAARALEPALGKSVRVVDSGMQRVGSDGKARFSADLKGFPSVSFDGQHPENVFSREDEVTLSSKGGELYMTVRDRVLLTSDQHPEKHYTYWNNVPEQKVAINHGLQVGYSTPRSKNSPPVGLFLYIMPQPGQA